jgi:hypothetical protein
VGEVEAPAVGLGVREEDTLGRTRLVEVVLGEGVPDREGVGLGSPGRSDGTTELLAEAATTELLAEAAAPVELLADAAGVLLADGAAVAVAVGTTTLGTGGKVYLHPLCVASKVVRSAHTSCCTIGTQLIIVVSMMYPSSHVSSCSKSTQVASFTFQR